MPRLIAVTAILSFVAVACEPYTVTHPGEYTSEGPVSRIATTYEGWWVGQYDGSGEVRLLTTGDDYDDVAACLNLWIDDTRLRVDAHVRLLTSPLEFKELSDGTYSGGQPTGCAAGEGGVLFEASTVVSSVTSKDTVLTWNNEISFFGLDRSIVLQLESSQSGFVSRIVASREDPHCPAGASCPWIEAAKLIFELSKTN
jgi:hypothetical protein